MYLKSLTLKGFKSFANKSLMQFEPGLTVVVGPNGSGKSNISDAILWVLGEQSAKQLRGQAMEDVIFAGSSTRAAVGVAEVTLVLDNSDHTLPVDYTEVAITRRMYRSGESEYLINGSAARLRDIQDILHDSGLGKDAHSIISQGKLEQVLTSKPEERRVLIEEAAGISKHRRRKERSVKKLAQMDASLTRARDLERSLMRQLRPLERQVDKAAQYNEYHSQVQALQTALAVDDLRLLKAQFDQLEDEEMRLEASCDVSRLTEVQRKDEVAQLEALLEEKGLFAGDLTGQRQAFVSARDRLVTLTRLTQQKQHHARGRLQALDVQEENSSRQALEDRRMLDEVQVELAGVQGQLDLHKAHIISLEQQAQTTKQERVDLDRTCAKAGHDAQEARDEADRCELELSRTKGALHNFEVQEGMYAARIERLREELATHEEALVGCNNQIKNESEALEQQRRACEDARQSRELCRNQLQEASQVLDECVHHHETLRSELNALQTVARTIEQQDQARYVWAHQAHTQTLLRSTLARLVKVPERYEALVETVCKEYLADYLAKNADAESLIDAALSITEAGSVRLFLEGSHDDVSIYPAVDGAVHLLSQLQIDPLAHLAFHTLLGTVYVVSTRADAVRLARQYPSYTFVTEDGRLRASQAMVQMSCVAAQNTELQEAGYLARERRMGELNQEIDRLNKRIEDTLRPAHNAATQRLEEAMWAFDQANAERQECKQRLTLAQREQERLLAAQRRLDAEYQQVHADARALIAQVEENKAAFMHMEAELETMRLAYRQAEEQLKRVQALRAEARTSEQRAQEQLTKAQLEMTTARERAKHLKSRAESLQHNLDRLKRLRSSAQSELRLHQMVIERIEPLTTVLLELEQQAEFLIQRVSEQVALEQEGSQSLKARVKEARNRLDEALAYTQSVVAAQSELKIEKAKLEVQVEQAVEAINETGAILEDALKLEPLESRSKTEEELAVLMTKIERLGPINHVAMHQYEELKAQHTYIAQQTADLDYARKAIQKIIAAIDCKMKDQFLQTFAQVDTNFREIFSTLFDGGQAHLELTDPDQPHETGIEVVAQPRGKRLTKMTLLSGGEKSLTAISLLFALYKTRTVPFYVLDEIEAALDDANLERLLRALDEFRTKTQLIVVSHQRKTMERADVLYGVSMHADGISQVVSQKLKDVPPSAMAPAR